MANFIKAGVPQLYIGASTDTKPTAAEMMSMCYETDTGYYYIWDGDSWEQYAPNGYFGHLLPIADNTYDLGSVALSWRSAYIDTLVYATAVVGNWSPSVDNTYDLGLGGGTPKEWKDLRVDGVAYLDDMSVPDGFSITSETTAYSTIDHDSGAWDIFTKATGDSTLSRLRIPTGADSVDIALANANLLFGHGFGIRANGANGTVVDFEAYENGAYVIVANMNSSATQANLTVHRPITVDDDILLALGTNGDQVMVSNSAGLATNTALTNVLIGTPVTPAIAANSLIVSNVTADGDVLMAGNDGGTSKAFLFFDSSTPDLYLYNVGGTWTAGATTWTIPAVTLGGAVAGGDQAFTGVGDMTFTAGSILKSGSTNTDTLLIAANDTTFITLTTGATDVCTMNAITASGTWLASGTWTLPAITLGGAITVTDDVLFTLGTNNDQVLLNRSATLTANTALAGVMIGTPVTPAVAANTLLVSNITASGDMLFAVNTGGHSQGLLFLDGSAGTLNFPLGATSGGNVNIGANLIKTTNCVIKEGAANAIHIRNAADDAYLYLVAQGFNGQNYTWGADASSMDTGASGQYYMFKSHITGGALAEVARAAGAADPYFMVGRNDTGMSTSTVTEIHRLQGGAGGAVSNGFGVGVGIYLGNNQAAEVEQRGTLEWSMVDVTNGSEDVKVDIKVMAGGAAPTSVFNAIGAGATIPGYLNVNGNIGLYTILQSEANATSITTHGVNDRYLMFKAWDTGVGQVEIARLQGAADPYFGLGVAGAGLKVTNGNLVGFFAATPVAQQTGTAAVTSNYAGTGDLDTEAELAAAINANGAAINLIRTALNNLGLTTTV